MSTHDRLSSINRSLITRDLCQGTSWQKFNWWLRPGTTIYLHSFSNRFRVLNEHRIVIMHGFIRFHSVNSALTFHFLAGCWHTRRIHAAYGRALLVWDPPRCRFLGDILRPGILSITFPGHAESSHESGAPVIRHSKRIDTA